ncbi:protein cramped [Venturia canescens]|uniref:protein cramped n=1 Tax=Venturia canescens TaxID=32260 RepID=UPI001C9BF9D1|nr:protein cramped [Venturia canescens]
MDNPSKLEESETKKDEPVTQNLDIKSMSDSKNVQARIVRGTKKMRIDSTESTQVSEQKKETKDEDTAEAKIVRSLKRSCELWSMEDKNTFFKAINEFGKDFDALQSYFLSQGKKRSLSDNMIKNKEQIRHFYYRTWLKISKHLKFSEDVKKATQEIYGLINYGELRRKLPRIHEKVLLKLNELIYWGSMQVRLRGKTMRIKTPICRALRKLNQLEDWQEEIKLPPRVTIELRPGNNMTWWQVQAHAMNPRVRTLLPIQRRLSSLLMFLQQRWKPAKYKTFINSSENLDQIDTKDNRLLRVSPPDGCKIALPVVNLGEYLTSNSVSFNSHEKRLGLKSSRLELLGSVQYIKGVGKKTIKKYKGDKRSSTRPEDSQQQPGDSSNNELDSPERSVNATPERNIQASTSLNVTDQSQPEIQTWSEPNRFPGRETVERIRLGWNIDEANSITVGDLFLMFGRESKVSLEYWWDTGGIDETVGTSGSKATRIGPSQTQDDGALCLALRKLLSIAKHNYGTSKIYDTVSGSNETVVSSRVPSAKESIFRRPLIPQVYHQIGAQDAFKTQLDNFKNRFCKRGRTVRQRSLIVQRTLPVTTFELNKPETHMRQPETHNRQPETNASAQEAHTNMEIQMSMDPQPANDNLVNIVTTNENEEFITGTMHVENPEAAKASNSIITSATQILKEGEHQWLNSEVADFSLSSFLGQLESPIKVSQSSQASGNPNVEAARPSSDVVSQMQCLMGESSVDYMAKFANLASQIASDEQKKSTS